jgi:hypothetical protein
VLLAHFYPVASFDQPLAFATSPTIVVDVVRGL